MKDFTELSIDELNNLDKNVLVTIIVSQQRQLTAIRSQLDFLTEQIALMNQRSFGRKTEKQSEFEQLNLFETFNEPEALSDGSPEPEITEVIISTHTRKKKSKREDNLEGLPARIFNHELTKEQLLEQFPNGYKELPIEIYKRLSIIPQTFLVDEHHVHVYASKDNTGTIIRADRPVSLFRNSIATPSIVTACIVSKYQNHLPLERQSKCFKDNGIKLETNTLANWMMKSSEYYLSIIYDELRKNLFSSRVVHADETPCNVIRDGRAVSSNSYMWVYRSGAYDTLRKTIIYDFQKSRRTDHPREFLKDYSGVLVTDGYQVYHTLDKEREDLQVAGCWVHYPRSIVIPGELPTSA